MIDCMGPLRYPLSEKSRANTVAIKIYNFWSSSYWEIDNNIFHHCWWRFFLLILFHFIFISTICRLLVLSTIRLIVGETNSRRNCWCLNKCSYHIFSSFDFFVFPIKLFIFFINLCFFLKNKFKCKISLLIC